MWNLAGTECRTLELYRILSRQAEVVIWSEHEIDPRLRQLVPIRPIRPWRLDFPRQGTLVFMGVYFDCGPWIHWAQPDRVIIVYNTDAPGQLKHLSRRLMAWRRRAIDHVFASEWLRDSVAGQGPVQDSPVDLTRFRPRDLRAPSRTFTVGRLSRDVPCKHHDRDPAFYRLLAEHGMKVRVLGGACMLPEVGWDCDVELLAEGAEEASAFLRGLDCFFYRTQEGFREPHGRVVSEAMACGLPVVCSIYGGYTEFIEHGRTGFLFRDEAEAIAILRNLQADPVLRARIGAAARAEAERMFSLEAIQRIARFYLEGPVVGS